MSTSVGINDLSVYIPAPMIEVETVVRNRILANPRLNRHLQRAVRVTGQQAIRFPEPWEDTATLAATATYDLLSRSSSSAPATIRHLVVGTESTLDLSKPISSMVQGMLVSAGVPLTSRMSSFQTQHACAGGTAALLSVSALLAASRDARDTGIAVSSDVARYEAGSTAEVTQGAGAVALALGRSPALVELDLGTVGYSSRDVDDFFRPVGSTVARVQGTYSMKCYEEGLDQAFLDHCDRLGRDPAQVLEETDMFVLHTPFRSLPLTALTGLLGRRLGLDEAEALNFLADRGLEGGLEPMGRIGNIYTASMWAVLAFQLRERLRALGDRIMGRRLLFASYGSGNTMMVFGGVVAAGAPSVIHRWDLDRVFGTARPASFAEYEAWLDRDPYAGPSGASGPVPRAPGVFHFLGTREDGYRRYGCGLGSANGDAAIRPEPETVGSAT